jgi:hypothetical protein
MTIYKIVKEDKIIFHTSYSHGSYSTKSSIEVKTLYKAKRKGKIFGFWHTIGNEYDGDIIGGPIPFTSENKEDVRNYIENYHLYYYNNLNYKIIDDTK